MLAALFAARGGASVTLVERNEKLGKKVYITGKGRCNLTNTAESEDFLRAVVRNPRFLYAAFAAFDNRDNGYKSTVFHKRFYKPLASCAEHGYVGCARFGGVLRLERLYAFCYDGGAGIG